MAPTSNLFETTIWYTRSRKGSVGGCASTSGRSAIACFCVRTHSAAASVMSSTPSLVALMVEKVSHTIEMVRLTTTKQPRMIHRMKKALASNGIVLCRCICVPTPPIPLSIHDGTGHGTTSISLSASIDQCSTSGQPSSAEISKSIMSE